MPPTEEAVTVTACPFCGGQPQSYWQGDTSLAGDDGYWAIECCHVHVHTDCEEGAITAWNTRAPSSADVLVEALEQGARWFEEYAVDHAVKARQAPSYAEQGAREDKAKRNQERADFLRQALATRTPDARIAGLVSALDGLLTLFITVRRRGGFSDETIESWEEVKSARQALATWETGRG